MNGSFSHFTTRNFAVMLLILYCIQYIPLESKAGVSYLKLGVSMLCPLVMISKSSWLSRPFYLLFGYYILVLFSALSHPATLRWSTVLFFISFMITYITYYNIITIDKLLKRKEFIVIIRRLIFAYAFILFLQHCFVIIGIKIFPLINLIEDLDRGIAGNSLSNEPSTAAVTISFTFLALLRMYEIDNGGEKISFALLWEKDKWIVVAFLYIMIGLVSGTAMIGLFLIATYFLSPKHFIVFFPISIILIIIFINIDFLPLNRARDSLLAFLTLDRIAVLKADGSSAARIIPIVNTISNLDLSSLEGWFGHGVDYGLSKGIFSSRVMIGGIADYGFLSFIVMQIIVYTCMIKKIISLETLLWMFLGMMTLSNVPVNWGAMMMCTTVKYFQENVVYEQK